MKIGNETNGEVVKLLDLANKDVTGVSVDIRSRHANGELRYPEQTPQPLITKLTRVWTEKDSKGQTWLRWTWEDMPYSPWACNYSGIVIDGDGPIPERAQDTAVLVLNANEMEGKSHA